MLIDLIQFHFMQVCAKEIKIFPKWVMGKAQLGWVVTMLTTKVEKNSPSTAAQRRVFLHFRSEHCCYSAQLRFRRRIFWILWVLLIKRKYFLSENSCNFRVLDGVSSSANRQISPRSATTIVVWRHHVTSRYPRILCEKWQLTDFSTKVPKSRQYLTTTLR